MGLISKIGLGTVQFGMDYGISNTTGRTSVAEVGKILNTAKANGINLIDTASGYGEAEHILGQYNLEGFRVISKFLPSDEEKVVGKTLSQSLRDLRLNKLYAYLAHRPLSLLGSSYWEDLKNLRDKGLVDKIGYSLNAPDELEVLLSKGYFPDVVQVPFNYFDHRFREQMKGLKNEGCEIHTRSTFLQGLFFMDPDELNPFFDEVKPQLKELQEKNRPIEEFLLNYVINKEYIDQVIIGVETHQQFLQNLKNIREFPNSKDLDISFSDEIVMPVNWPKE